MKRDIPHDVPSHLIHKIANMAAGSAEAMAKALGVSTSLVQKWAQEAPDDMNLFNSGTTNNLDRIEAMMIECANAGEYQVAYLFLKYVWEVFDQIKGDYFDHKVKDIKEVKSGESKTYMKFVNAARFFMFPLIGALTFYLGVMK